MANVLPRPTSLSTSTRPPCSSVSCLTIANPSPVESSPPVGRAERRWKRLKSRLRSSSVRPGPSSRTSKRTLSASRCTVTRMGLCSGENLMALLTRLSIASISRSRSALVRQGASQASRTSCWPFSSASGRLRRTMAAASACRLTGSRSSTIRPLSMTAESSSDVTRWIIWSDDLWMRSSGSKRLESAPTSFLSSRANSRMALSGFFMSCAAIWRSCVFISLASRSTSFFCSSARLSRSAAFWWWRSASRLRTRASSSGVLNGLAM